MQQETTIDMRRPATWLEIVRSARQDSADVSIHPVPGEDGARMAVAIESRPLCSTNGQITIFEDLAAAVRFLSIAGVKHWDVGEALDGLTALLPGAERLRLRGGELRC